MASPDRLTLSQATGITSLCVITALVILVTTFERTYVAQRQHDDSAFASASTLMWQHPRFFYYLWMIRGTLSTIACLFPLPPMWVEYMLQPANETPGLAVVWAASALVACIASGIAAERLLYLGFTDSLNAEQCACAVASAIGIILLVLGELVNLLPVPIAWSVSGCALHRFSMIAWWYIVTTKPYSSRQFRDRARLTLAGHGVAFACLFLSFLPVFESGLNRLFWLFSLFFAVEIITTAQAARMTYLCWLGERMAWQPGGNPAPPPHPSDPFPSLFSLDLPLHDLHPPLRRDVDQIALADMRLAVPEQRSKAGQTFYDDNDSDAEEVPMAAVLAGDGGQGLRSPAPTRAFGRRRETPRELL